MSQKLFTELLDTLVWEILIKQHSICVFSLKKVVLYLQIL